MSPKRCRKELKRSLRLGYSLARDLLLVHVRGWWASLGYFPSPMAVLGARRKLLKIERLERPELARKVTFFRQASDGRKRETVWVTRRASARGQGGT